MVSGGGGECLAGFVMKDVARSTSGFTGSCSPRLIGPSGPNPSRGFGGGRKRLEIAPKPSSLDRELSTGVASCVLPLEERGVVIVTFITLWRGRHEAGPITLGDVTSPRPPGESFLELEGSPPRLEVCSDFLAGAGLLSSMASVSTGVSDSRPKPLELRLRIARRQHTPIAVPSTVRDAGFFCPVQAYFSQIFPPEWIAGATAVLTYFAPRAAKS
jgi:hypothetical protein